MWKVTEMFFLWAVALFIFTNMILPLFIPGMKPFWIFKKKWLGEVFMEKEERSSLMQRMKIVKPVIEDVKKEVDEIQKDAAADLTKVERIKKQADNLI